MTHGSAQDVSTLTILVREGRLEEAVVRATKARSVAMKRLVLDLVVADAPRALVRVVALISREVIEHLPGDAVERLVVATARHAPTVLPAVLDAVPEEAELVLPLFEAATRADDARRELMILGRALELPVPTEGASRARYRDMLDKTSAIAVRLGQHLIAARAAQRAEALFEENDVALESDEVEETARVRRRGPDELTASSR